MVIINYCFSLFPMILPLLSFIAGPPLMIVFLVLLLLRQMLMGIEQRSSVGIVIGTLKFIIFNQYYYYHYY